MHSLRLKSFVRYTFVVGFVFFAANKFALRPFVLARDSPEWLRVFVLSVPNTIEAVYGTLSLSSLLIVIRDRRSPRFDHISDSLVYIFATLLAAIYVITQEMKFHNLGGRNVYDPFDVIASIVGLVGILLVLLRFGIFEDQPSLELDNDSV